LLTRKGAKREPRLAVVERGLVIKQPWVGMIADGKKIWEMRTRRTRLRGWIGLIEKGAGQVVGVAYLKASPLAARGRKSFSGKYVFPWVMSRAIRLPKPVAYKHPHGAVTWVKFSDGVSRALARHIRKNYPEELS
jgi:hypothetical protein